MNKRELDVYLLAAQQYRESQSYSVDNLRWDLGPHGFASRIREINGESIGLTEVQRVSRRLEELGFFEHVPEAGTFFYNLTPKALPCSTASS